MTEKDLKFLDFILPILSEKYPDYIAIHELNDLYKKQDEIDFGYRELPIFVAKYENKYFEKVSKKRHIRILTDWIEIINKFGSLSRYLESENKKLLEIQDEENEMKNLQKKISILEIENLKLQNRKLKRELIFGIIGFIIAAIVTNWKDILILLKILPPE